MLTRTDLRPYQVRAIEYIRSHDNCALYLDPGLGKTVSSLTAYADLRESFDVRRALVVAPLRVARKVWSDEIKEWSHLGGIEIARMHGSVENRMKALCTPADIHTINRENLSWLEAQFIQGKKQIRRWPWDFVILDESQSFMSQSAQRFKSARRLRRLFPRCVELTGTPSPNGYKNLWSQIFLLDGGQRLGRTEKAFLDRWFDAPRQGGFAKHTLKGDWAKTEIQGLLADIVLSMRAEDYLDLPPVNFVPVRVELPGPVLSKYRKFAREYILELKSQKIVTAVNAGVLHGKLLQLANGAVYVDDKGGYEIFHNEKIDVLLETLEALDGKGPVLIGYEFRSDLERIKEALTRYCGEGKTWKLLRSDASFDEWKMGLTDFGVLHPGSAGHGLNDVYKSGAQDLVWFGLTPNYELYDQLNKRLTGGHRRVGKNITIHHILADDTEDMKTFHLLTRKGAEQDDLTRAMARLVA